MFRSTPFYVETESTVQEPLQQIDCVPIEDHSLPAATVITSQIHPSAELKEFSAPLYIP